MGYTTQQDPFSAFFTTFSSPVGWLIIPGLIILVFLITREILCWYWKINECFDSFNEIKGEIATIKKQPPRRPKPETSPRARLHDDN